MSTTLFPWTNPKINYRMKWLHRFQCYSQINLETQKTQTLKSELAHQYCHIFTGLVIKRTDLPLHLDFLLEELNI